MGLRHTPITPDLHRLCRKVDQLSAEDQKALIGYYLRLTRLVRQSDHNS